MGESGLGQQRVLRPQPPDAVSSQEAAVRPPPARSASSLLLGMSRYPLGLSQQDPNTGLQKWRLILKFHNETQSPTLPSNQQPRLGLQGSRQIFSL